MASSLRYPDLFEIEGGFGPQGIRALLTGQEKTGLVQALNAPVSAPIEY